MLSAAVLSEAVLVLSAAVLELRESQALLIYGSKQTGLSRESHRLNRSPLCSVIRARARSVCTSRKKVANERVVQSKD